MRWYHSHLAFMVGGTTVRIGVMRLMFLRAAVVRYSEKSHSYYSENQGYVNILNLKLGEDQECSKRSLGLHNGNGERHQSFKMGRKRSIIAKHLHQQTPGETSSKHPKGKDEVKSPVNAEADQRFYVDRIPVPLILEM